jgi:hypothetical protein
MRAWKLLGLAGILAGVATGAAVARDERVRRHYDADEIRQRLHARHDEAVARDTSATPDAHQPG